MAICNPSPTHESDFSFRENPTQLHYRGEQKREGSDGRVLTSQPLSEEAADWATVAAEVQAMAESSPYCDDKFREVGRWFCTRAISMEF